MDSFEISVLTFSVKGVGFYRVTVAALATGIFAIGWVVFVLRGFGPEIPRSHRRADNPAGA